MYKDLLMNYCLINTNKEKRSCFFVYIMYNLTPNHVLNKETNCSNKKKNPYHYFICNEQR